MTQKFITQKFITQKFITLSPAETKKLGERLAKQVLKLKKGPRERALVISLIGELGGGKTTFLQGFAKGLGIRKRILSPTFVLMKRFKIHDPRFTKFTNFYHIDCYRIENPQEILDLGLADIIQKSGNIVAVEWADRIQKILPKHRIIMKFGFLDKNKRAIKISIYPAVDNLSLTGFRNALK